MAIAERKKGDEQRVQETSKVWAKQEAKRSYQ
jgi:hypothetical protein